MEKPYERMGRIKDLSLVFSHDSFSPLAAVGQSHRFAKGSLAWVGVVVHIDQRPGCMLGYGADSHGIPSTKPLELGSVVTGNIPELQGT
jgi:hypothetical protein